MVRIEPSRGRARLGLGEVWEYRELLYFLVWRDVKVRYKQTVIGAGWAVAQPFGAMVLFSLFFGMLARLPTDGLPAPVFYYSALVPWTFFASALTQATNAIVDNQRLVTKVYFPRVILPAAAVLAALVDLAIASGVLLVLLLVHGLLPPVQVVLLPLFVGLIALAALAAAWRPVRSVAAISTASAASPTRPVSTSVLAYCESMNPNPVTPYPRIGRRIHPSYAWRMLMKRAEVDGSRPTRPSLTVGWPASGSKVYSLTGATSRSRPISANRPRSGVMPRTTSSTLSNVTGKSFRE